MEIVKSILHKT